MNNTPAVSQNNTLTTNNYNYTMRIAELSPEKRSEYLALTKSIDVHDITTVQQYGAELSAVVAQNGNTLLEAVRSDNSSEVVQLTNDLLEQLNLINVDELNTDNKWKSFWMNVPIIGKMMTSVKQIMTKYDTVAEKVEGISKKMGTTKIVAMRDNSTLQQIYDNNKIYIEKMQELILGAKLREQQITDEISEMQMHPEKYQAYEIQDVISFRNSLQKRIADMETTEYVLTQNMYQIRATQGNNIAVADKADNIVNNIIPTWKSQLAISIIMNNQKASIDAQRRITDATNEILRKNAESLKINSIDAARANEESVINIETLKQTTQNLIETISEVRKIHEEGARNRQAIEHALATYSEQLENAIGITN